MNADDQSSFSKSVSSTVISLLNVDAKTSIVDTKTKQLEQTDCVLWIVFAMSSTYVRTIQTAEILHMPTMYDV